MRTGNAKFFWSHNITTMLQSVDYLSRRPIINSCSILSILFYNSMEVFRQNLQLLEEQQLSVTAAGGQLGQPSAPPPAPQPALAPPPLLLPDLGTEITPLQTGHTPHHAPGLMPSSMYALAQSNNNNSLPHSGHVQLKPFTGGVAGVQSPSSISVPAAHDLTRSSYVYPLCATQMPLHPIASAPGPGQSPAAPVMISNKLKATPTLISIQSSRDHKFMPYWVTQPGLWQR